ncbi:MAG: tyrosine-type recombinase/integrase [Candidatus Acidiferrales bacterium]
MIRPPSDRALHRSAVERLLDVWRRRAGLGRITAHMFRHSFATHLLDHGADLQVIQALLGHARLSSTEYYVHLSRAKISSTFYKCHPDGGTHGATSEGQDAPTEASHSG